jgi:CRISPR/Cas system-associated exonuclease Cas4 (RecB family)
MEKETNVVKENTGTARKAKYKDTVFSFSKISDFLFCPKRYKHKFIDNVKEASNVFKDYGLKIHDLSDQAVKKNGTIDHETAADIFRKNGLNELDISRGLAYMEYLSKYSNILSEYRFELKLKRGISVEFHIDRIFFDEYGTCFIQDLKTSPQPLDEEQIEADLQLDIYCWAFVEYLKQILPDIKKELAFLTDKKKTVDAAAQQAKPQTNEQLELLTEGMRLQNEINFRNNLINTAGEGKIVKGIWLWRYNYKAEVEHKRSDLSDQLIYTIEHIKKCKEFTPKANRFCADCDYFRTCYPVPITKSYKELKALEAHYKKLAEDRKNEIVQDGFQIGSNLVSDNGTQVYIKETTSKEYDPKAIKEIVEKAGLDPFEFLKPDNAAVNREQKKKSKRFTIEPISVSVSLRIDAKDKLKEGGDDNADNEGKA